MQVSSTVWFHFQQDAAPAHAAKLAQDWIASNCSEFSGKIEWPPNSPDVNPLDYRDWGVRLQQDISSQAKEH